MRPSISHDGVGTLRVFLLVACPALLFTGCQSRVTAPSPERCSPDVPPTAQHPLATPAGALAGEYDLIQVRTQPVAGVRSVGRLHLARPDSMARAGAVGGATRDLVGWLETVTGDSDGPATAGSRDPLNPGVVVAGDHLRLGQPGAVNAHIEQLTITAVAADGFWGWWKAVPGWDVALDAGTKRMIPDPAGYFCALRVRP